ncbi:hypothetical protein Y032_0007g3429 [Ancylostoma ceylanicum]|uniref:Uncharacterized protein n=1 Tax=Ancylostoma ceylanicum TaxID=53326 RepID=A0A016VMF3_9BILA|nr:hypothetical protein Y032_0007g3429 [Ancylostoma ceylanicum]
MCTIIILPNSLQEYQTKGKVFFLSAHLRIRKDLPPTCGYFALDANEWPWNVAKSSKQWFSSVLSLRNSSQKAQKACTCQLTEDVDAAVSTSGRPESEGDGGGTTDESEVSFKILLR